MRILIILAVLLCVALYFFDIRTFAGTVINRTLTSNVDLERGLVAHWTFDGGDVGSGEVYDISGNESDGTLSTEVYTAGVIGQALENDSSTLVISDYSQLYTPNAFSNSFWIRTKANSSGLNLIRRDNEATGQRTNRIYLYNDEGSHSTDNIQVLIGDLGGSWGLIWYPNVVIVPDEWTYVTLTWDGSTAAVYKMERL